MALARRTGKATKLYGYTVEEVARFLQYDRDAVRYWLRTGHLTGRYDDDLEDWRVTAPELVTFLRQTSEPMPTGVIGDFGWPSDGPTEEIVLAADDVEPTIFDFIASELEAATEDHKAEDISRVRMRETVLPAC